MVFEAAQIVPANLEVNNQITLSYDSANHVFYFNLTAGIQPGSFHADNTWTVKSNILTDASV